MNTRNRIEDEIVTTFAGIWREAYIPAMTNGMVFCSKCGAQNSASATFCQRCGAGMGMGMTAASSGGVPVVYAQGVPVAGYGGFWIRFLAFVIDGIIVRLITVPFALLFTAMGILRHIDQFHDADMNDPHWVLPFVGAFVALLPLFLAINWLYEALLTSSQWQATLGKKALNLRVTDEAGNRISFARATGRHFAKFLSSFLFIGFIMAAFTDRKRALHDIIAGTLVRKG